MFRLPPTDTRYPSDLAASSAIKSIRSEVIHVSAKRLYPKPALLPNFAKSPLSPKPLTPKPWAYDTERMSFHRASES